MPRQSRTPWLGKEPNQHVWYIYWYSAPGRIKRRSAGTSDRGEAEEILGRFLIERAKENVSDVIATPDRYTVATALRWYLQERAPEISTSDLTARVAERLLEFFGSRTTVANVTPQLIKRYERERQRKPRVLKKKNGNVFVPDNRTVTTGTIRRELVVLSAALNHAVKNGRLTSAPRIHMPPMGQGKTRFLEKEEIKSLLANANPHTRLFITLGINTGARKGALLDLKWSQIDFKNRIINLNPEGRAQTSKRRAIVPMNDLLYETLLKARAEQEEYVRKKSEKECESIEPSDYVITFCNLPVANIRHGFNRACERAGIKGVTPHTLRHTAGTLMALAGIDLFLIAKVLGHSVQKTTELYAHFQPEYLRSAVDVLGKAITRPAPTASNVGNLNADEARPHLH